MPADISRERAVGLRMQTLAVGAGHDEWHHGIAVCLSDGIDGGACDLRDRFDLNDSRRSSAGPQGLQAPEQARGKVIVAAGRHHDHLGIARNERHDRRGADAEPSAEPAFAKEGSQIFSDRIADEGARRRRRRCRWEEQEGECRCNEVATHSPNPEQFRQRAPLPTAMY